MVLKMDILYSYSGQMLALMHDQRIGYLCKSRISNHERYVCRTPEDQEWTREIESEPTGPLFLRSTNGLHPAAKRGKGSASYCVCSVRNLGGQPTLYLIVHLRPWNGAEGCTATNNKMHLNPRYQTWRVSTARPGSACRGPLLYLLQRLRLHRQTAFSTRRLQHSAYRFCLDGGAEHHVKGIWRG